ncbi:MAG: hypothetical protein ACLFU9_00835 [Candidatus Bathyarchaeia archaeon]
MKIQLPRILVTTSRNPTQTMRTFCNDLAGSIPNSIRINRGKSSLDRVAEKALEQGAEKVIIADRWKGGLGKIQLLEIGETGLVHFYPLIYVKNLKLRREFGSKQSQAIKSLVLQIKTNVPPEVYKLADVFSQFFSIPKLSIDEQSAANIQAVMHISTNPANRIQIEFLQLPQRIEIGPRITISHLVWRSQK